MKHVKPIALFLCVLLIVGSLMACGNSGEKEPQTVMMVKKMPSSPSSLN